MVRVTSRVLVSGALNRTLDGIRDGQVLRSHRLSFPQRVLSHPNNCGTLRLQGWRLLLRCGCVRDLGSSINLSLRLLNDLSRLHVIIIDNELKGPILVILEVFEPIMEVVAETLVGLHQVVGHATPLGRPSPSRILLLCAGNILLAVRALLRLRILIQDILLLDR